MNLPIFKNRIFLFTAILMLCTFTFTGTSCRLLKRDKQSIADKKAEDTDKKAVAEYEKARKQHYDHQNKKTQKMMKQTKKQAAVYNKPKKRKHFLGIKCK